MLRSLFVATIMTVSFGALAHTIKHGPISIEKIWARPANKGQNTAAYGIFSVEAGQGDRLIKAECAQATTVELHNHIEENGIMKMRPVSSVDLADKPVEMKPGGMHIMLMGLKEDLKDQKTVKVSLEFEKAGKVDVNFPVGQPKA